MKNKETWKPVAGYEGRYEVSDRGRVRTLCRIHGGGSRLLVPRVKPSGHLEVRLFKDGKHRALLVHRLVAMAFVEGYADGLVVNHRDENPQNNRADNLEWTTIARNNGYGRRGWKVSRTLRGLPVKSTYRPMPVAEVKNLEGEEWRAVVGYEGRYEVSNMGRVKSLDRQRRQHPLFRLHPDAKDGYVRINLRDGDGKCHAAYVHRLVAQAFVGGYRQGYEVNHRDEDKTNNRWDNLEWVSKRANINHGTRNSRCAEKRGKAVRQYALDGTFIAEYPSICAAAQAVGAVSGKGGNIRMVLSGKRQTASGYRWQYGPKIRF